MLMTVDIYDVKPVWLIVILEEVKCCWGFSVSVTLCYQSSSIQINVLLGNKALLFRGHWLLLL